MASDVVRGSWEVAAAAPDAMSRPEDIAAARIEWIPATVPGTVGDALRNAGALDVERDLDAEDWWWRGRFAIQGDGPWTLRIGGLATVADVWVDGVRVHTNESMFEAVDVPIGPTVSEAVEVVVRCAALAPLLTTKRPRPRWRTALVSSQNLRWYRTTFAGRMPGWWPSLPPVGPWRGIELVRGPRVIRRSLRATFTATGEGTVAIAARLAGVSAGAAVVRVGRHEVAAELRPDGAEVVLDAIVTVREAAAWWPHTSGEQPLSMVTVSAAGVELDLGAVGFRTIEVDERDGGFTFVVNGVPLLTRGAVWMPVDPIRASASSDALRAALGDVRAAGLNMLRLSGTTWYESDDFHDLCDELGILVWQDLMVANIDLPTEPEFEAHLEEEVRQLTDRIGWRPSTAIVCGSSEGDQQPAMLGLPPDTWRPTMLGVTVPALVRERAPEVAYVPSTPSGGTFPFTTDTGVTHYYGVGAYRRPFDDVRRSNVRFAAECLAFSNLGDTDQDPGAGAWRVGVPRDNGSTWDFADIRDHYVAALFDVDVDLLRADDVDRYLELGQAATGLAMVAVFSEWSRPAGRAGGGLVWTWRDLTPGSGWGVIDSTGERKPAWWFVRRACAPIAIVATDEGLNGLHLHVRNDRPEAFTGTVRVELFRGGEQRLEVGERDIVVDARSATTIVADALFEGFRDLTWAYRFGPLTYDVIAATLIANDGSVSGRVVYMPAGHARLREADLGIAAHLVAASGGWEVHVRSAVRTMRARPRAGVPPERRLVRPSA